MTRDELPEGVLTADQRRALLTACVTMVDEELELLLDGDHEHGAIFAFLPPIAQGEHEHLTYKQLLVALVTVGQKLTETDAPELSCVAEEMALSLLVLGAESHLELWGVDHPGFAGYYDSVYQDTDFEMLWDRSLDGIEDSELGRELGVGHLHPRDWGKPFSNTSPPHPFLAGA